ncbi:MAG TPA: hypothetical protein PKD00_00755 [Burkholderiales bacterium]|nr:hypothetical protein [Burkholderiales bacterium]
MGISKKVFTFVVKGTKEEIVVSGFDTVQSAKIHLVHTNKNIIWKGFEIFKVVDGKEMEIKLFKAALVEEKKKLIKRVM